MSQIAAVSMQLRRRPIPSRPAPAGPCDARRAPWPRPGIATSNSRETANTSSSVPCTSHGSHEGDNREVLPASWPSSPASALHSARRTRSTSTSAARGRGLAPHAGILEPNAASASRPARKRMQLTASWLHGWIVMPPISNEEARETVKCHLVSLVEAENRRIRAGRGKRNRQPLCGPE